MPIWLAIVLMVVGILGVALMIYSMTLMPPRSIVLLVVAFIIILGTTLPMIATMAAEAPKQSSGGITPQTPTTTSMPPACYWVWTDKVHDPTDEWSKLLLVGQPVVGCEQPGWNVSEKNIPPYCWCP